jgi:hypothetical protein
MKDKPVVEWRHALSHMGASVLEERETCTVRVYDDNRHMYWHEDSTNFTSLGDVCYIRSRKQ